jgi:hypothetical protein
LSQASEKFVQIENQSSSFFATTFYFFCFNVPLVLLIFISLRCFFYLLFEYKASSLIREYAFKLFIVCLLMEGNHESFSYYFIFDVTHLGSKSHLQKGINCLTVLFFAMFFSYLTCWFFAIKMTQKKEAKHFFSNLRSNLKVWIHVTIECGLLNFCLAACHILIENDYNYQLLALTCV